MKKQLPKGHEDPQTGWISINTIWHKIGLHGKVFMLIDNEWIRSSKTVDDLAKYTRRTKGSIYEGKMPELT